MRLKYRARHASTVSTNRVRGALWSVAILFPCIAAHGAGAIPPTTLPLPCAAGNCGNTGPSKLVTSGTASVTQTGSTQLTVTQQSSQAILNWSTFNIGAGNKVTFNQPSTSAIALNRIFDNNPSNIFGSLTANGQVYLVNQNGIIFGATAQVNVNTLVASTLNIDDPTFLKGILAPTLLANHQPAFAADGRTYAVDQNGNPVLDANGNPIKVAVVVDAGAQIATPDAGGGRIMLLGQEVDNAGSLSSPGGQVILAAGQKAYLQASNDPTLRGLVVEVDGGGPVSNQLTGNIATPTGNVTLVGLAVNQQGRISATSTVSANGSIRLEAADTAQITQNQSTFNLDASETGTLELGPHSVTSVTPDSQSTATAVDSQVQNPSTVQLVGHQIHLAGGSQVIANGGDVDIHATLDPFAAEQSEALMPVDPQSQVRVDSGALIDVSGSNVTLPIEANIVSAQLRGSELENFPQQRNGALRGQTVYVDVRADGGKGTTIADVSGEIAGITRGVGERTTAGGSVSIQSEGDAVLAPGSNINVSGGSVTYMGGVVATTQLVTADGRVTDIGDADPTATYTGVINPTVSVTHYKWGVIDTFPLTGDAHYEAGYVQGASAGTVQLAARSLVVDGTLLGSAVSGPYQRSSQPLGGLLEIGSSSTPTDFIAPSVFFSAAVSPIVVAPGEPIAGIVNLLSLPVTYLTQGGFTRTAIYSDGQIELPANLPLSLPPNGSLSLTAPRIDILSNISSPGGTLSLTAATVGSSVQTYTGRSGIDIGAGLVFDFSGRWVNDAPSLAGSNPTDPLAINGGSVTVDLVSTGGELAIGDNVLIDVSAGAHAAAYGSLTTGSAGQISLAAPASGSLMQIGTGIELAGFGVNGSQGGALNIAANRIDVVHSTIDGLLGQSVDFGAAASTAFNLSDALFAHGGFSNITVFGTGQMGQVAAQTVQPFVVEGNANIDMVIADRNLSSVSLRDESSGTALSSFAPVGAEPAFVAPVTNLTFGIYNSGGFGAANSTVSVANAGNLVIAAGAQMSANPGSSFSFQAPTSVYMSGTVRAPNGTISLSLEPPPSTGLDAGYQAAQGIYLATGSTLDVSGTTVFAPSAAGLRVGSVLPGGSVNIVADRGSIFGAAGSAIDVSGTRSVLDLPTGSVAAGVAPQTVASAGGSIVLTASEVISLDTSLSARSGAAVGSAGPAGGSLAVTLSRSDYQPASIDANVPLPPSDPRTVLLGPGTLQSSSHYSVLNETALEAAGFSSLAVSADDAIDLTGGTPLTFNQSLTLSAPNLVSFGAAAVTLRAPVVALGPQNAGTQSFNPPSSGSAALNVQAGLIQLNGNVSLQGFAQTTLTSSSDLQAVGELSGQQLIGSFNTVGSLTLAARQIYPSTLSQFTFAVPGGVIATQSTGSAESVLSAAGSLTLSAQQIVHDGAIEAPFGTVTMNGTQSVQLGPQSVLSVSGTGQNIPYGVTQNGTAWVYFLGGSVTLPITAPPAKQVALSAPSVQVASGATVDLSGGGDLFAYEYVPGLGGTSDVLAATTSPNSFAILPQLQTYAPVDLQYDQGSSLRQGAAVYLSGVPGELAAGTYTILPARYALLPGAFLVTQQSADQDLLPGQAVTLGNGAPVVSGYLTTLGTNLRDSRTSGFAIEPGSYVAQLAEYDTTSATTFFAAQAAAAATPVPQLPIDAGALALSVGTALQLGGTIDTKPAAGGRGATVDVSASNLQIVSQETVASAPGVVQVTAASLEDLGAQSLLIGGTRASSATTSTTATTGTTIQVAAQDVSLTAGTILSAPEILLVAQDTVSIGPGAQLSATGPVMAGGGGMLTLQSASGNNALARVSSSDQVEVSSTTPNSAAGTVTVAAGAVLSGPGSITLTATHDTLSQGTLQTAGGSVSLGASQISLGDVVAATPGLVLTNAQLNLLGSASDLRLISQSSIDFYGNVALGAVNAQGTDSLGSLLLDAGALRGFGSSGSTSDVAATTVRLTNSNANPVTAAVGSGTGNLQISSANLTLDTGAYGFSGFNSVGLTSRGDVIANGTVGITSLANLTLTGARIFGNSGADVTMTAPGHAFTTTSAPLDSTLSTATPGLGTRWSVTADSIDHGGNFLLPSGQLSLDAVHDVSLQSGSLITVAGGVQNLSSDVVVTPGGSVQIRSETGNVILANQAKIDVSGGSGGGDAGSLTIDAAGTTQFDGVLAAQAIDGARGGSFSLQTGQLQNFAPLTAALNAAGFSRQQDFTVATGDLALPVGGLVKAQAVSITVNGGSLLIDGQIDARGATGGSVQLNARDNLTLGATGEIDVNALGTLTPGGFAELNSTQGTISTAAGSVINASGTSTGGQIVFRAAATGTGVAITALQGAMLGADAVTVDVVHAYDNVATVDTTLQATVANDLANFTSTAAQITASLGQGTNTVFGVQAAVELRSAGDMTVNAPWDLLNLRPNGLAGELTLRAAGNLIVSQDISDGFVASGSRLALQSGPSWSYHLTGGADLNSTDIDAVVPAAALSGGTGNVAIGSGVSIRTGTGSIHVSAGNDISFADQTSVLFTAGTPVANMPPVSASDPTSGTLNWSSNGGNITLAAGRDVVGAVTNQVVTSWQLRKNESGATLGGSSSPGEWGIDFSKFQENVGALGGGNVVVSAARDVSNFSAAAPTTGLGNADGTVTTWGGGNLSVTAGRDLTSGVYYVGQGEGELRAGRSISPGENVNGNPFGTILALGDGSFNVTAGNTLEVASVLNPTVIGQPTSRLAGQSYFFTYSAASSVDLLALSGSLTLENNHSNFVTDVANNIAQNTREPADTWYPGKLTAAALGGDVNVENDFVQFPSVTGNLILEASKNVNLTNATITESGVDPALLPSPLATVIGLNAAASILTAPPAVYPSDLHASDSTPAQIIAAQGDILGGVLYFPKPAQLIAGRDINGVNLQTNNFQATDVTLLQAGRDITYEGDQTGQITVGGPGYVDLFAGRNLDLAASNGISTIGATANSALPSTTGATVNAFAGLTQQPAYSAFVADYFDHGSTYSTQLTQFMQTLTGTTSLDPAKALSGFDALTSTQQLPLILSAFFNELNQAGLEATSNQAPGYARGFAAIDTLFPGSLAADGTSATAATLPYAGNLELSFSRVYTLAGGDINLLVPGGFINVGLATAPVNAPVRSPSQLGIVAQGAGSVNAFTYGDVEVNQSRVFTLDGGNILIWSSTGNIDAGRGAKTSISAPAPVLIVDPVTGEVTVDLSGAVAGSGIRTILTDPNVPPGDVNLVAPVGTVNAGDAGIGSAGNINIAAQTVLGASNINFGGTATGVPAATSGLASGLTSVSNTANSASNAAVDGATTASTIDKSTSVADAALGWLDVFVTGLGEENCKPDDVDCMKRQHAK